MPSQPADAATPPSESELCAAALARLRFGRNPFARQVTAVGTAEESILAGVPEFAASQLAELLEIIGQHRAGKMATRAYPLLGERGAGKTHLLYTLRDELRTRATDVGEETLLVIVERLSPGMDAIDYLLWQIVNHLLTAKGDGARVLGTIAGRLTARLLGEAIRQLAPHQRTELIPTTGLLGRLGFGSAARAQAKLAAIGGLVQRCEAKHPTSEGLRTACGEAGVTPATAVRVVDQHLDRAESKDVAGWFRRELYGRLARLALLGDRVPFEELHDGDFEDAPTNVRNAGNLNRYLLHIWLELLSVLEVPVVVVFDQLEDYLRHPDPGQEKLTRQFFTDATARFVNELRNVCLLIFAEEALWTDLINRAEAFVRERLTQRIDLPGRPAKSSILMPGKVEPEMLERIIQRRIVAQFADLDLTGLPPMFPFEPSDLQKLQSETTVRACLRQLAKRYDEIVFQSPTESAAPGKPPPEPPRPGLKQRLLDVWQEKVEDAAKQFGEEMVFKVSFIPEVQNALDGWLQCLAQTGLTGSGPWQKVELVTDSKKGQYGYLNVIRTDGPNAPGVAIAVWLGETKARPYDLRERIGFFKSKPCPVRTLVLLRADGEAALTGESLTVYRKATNAGRDVRVHQYEPRHMHALMAFGPWHQIAIAEVQNAEEAGPGAEDVFRAFLADLSKEWIGWVDRWRTPKAVTTSAARGADA